MDLLNAAVDHTLGHLAFFIGFLRRDRSALSTAGHLLGGRGHFIDGSGHLIRLVTLTLHGLLRTMSLIRYLPDQRRQLERHVRDLTNHRVDFIHEAVERTGQVAKFVLTGDRQTVGQVTLARGNIVQVGFHQVQGTQDGIGYQHANHCDDQENDKGNGHDAEDHALHALFDTGFDLRHLCFDAIEVNDGTDHHVPFGQVLGIAQFGY